MEIIGSDKAVATNLGFAARILLQERDASAGQAQSRLHQGFGDAWEISSMNDAQIHEHIEASLPKTSATRAQAISLD